MNAIHSLSASQQAVQQAPVESRTFAEGRAGSGKTTAAVERLLAMMAQGAIGSQILVLLPQRTLAGPYQAALNHPGVLNGGYPVILTLGGLARRMSDLFWPLIAGQAGFHQPDDPPIFLTLETAQYFMAHLLRPQLDQGMFSSVNLERNRLYSQILDNLNKAAVVGFPHTEIGERLSAAWQGDSAQLRIFADVQTAASLYRQYCLEHNLLDFSLQVEVFRSVIWQEPTCRCYLESGYTHLIADNIEEDTPIFHDLLIEWLPLFQSALLVYDADAGYRSFLGADSLSALRLKELCSINVEFHDRLVSDPHLETLSLALQHTIAPPSSMSGPSGGGMLKEAGIHSDTLAPIRTVLFYAQHRYFPQMLDWVTGQVASEVRNEGTSPGEIVILSPFLSDALRHALAERLLAEGIPARSHRPSRSLRDEPAAQCLLTLAAVAHPDWEYPLTRFDVAYALLLAIQDLDLTRAQLLAEIVFRTRQGKPFLGSFDQIRPEIQERITYQMGERYQVLSDWLERYQSGAKEELDVFFSRLFGEVLSQPGFGFHTQFDTARVISNLVESVQKFRWAAGEILHEEDIILGKEYLAMVQNGVLAAQYLYNWQTPPGESVLLAPAYTFLLSNQPVDVQFWLDVGSRGWGERLYQPLTNPYVLSRQWEANRTWSDLDEVITNRQILRRLAAGLLARCRRRLYLGLSELNEGGYEQKGPLLHAINRLLREVPPG